MDLKELLGEAFKEDMTLEEVQTALADKELVDAATVPQNVVEKKVFDKTASELSALKKQLKDLERAKMTEEEQRAAAYIHQRVRKHFVLWRLVIKHVQC